MKNGIIFGMVLVDICTPAELKADFQEMTPIFKNVMVSRNDLGEHTKKHQTELHSIHVT